MAACLNVNNRYTACLNINNRYTACINVNNRYIEHKMCVVHGAILHCLGVLNARKRSFLMWSI